MRKSLPLVALVVAAASFGVGCAGPEAKLGRGLANATEFLRGGEMRRSIEQHSLFEGPDVGATTGVIRGFNRSVARTFYGAVEGFTMLVAEPLNQIPPAPPRVVIARMELTGSSVTTVAAIAVPESACQLIGEAATGQDDVSDGPDAVLELLNVACGQLVDTLGGGPFTMNPPTADVTSGTGAWNEVSSMSRVLAFDLEGIPLLFGVTVSNRWCPECRHDASESS